MKIRILKLNDSAVLPKYTKTGDAGCDLVSTKSVVLKAGGGREIIPTGIALEIPKGYVGLVAPRSGLAAKHGITCVNSPGIIDSGYRGEICVILANTDPENDFKVEAGDRIAQLMIQQYVKCVWDEVDKLSDSERHNDGFGSSGVKSS
jgi:dUTP pyrophosphatase